MRKQGFTLLELLVVIIIIGVLTALALPRLWSVIELSRSAEAMGRITQIRSSMERCFLINDGDYDKCKGDALKAYFPDLPFATLPGIEGAFLGENFMYEIFPFTHGPDGYVVNCYRTQKDGGGPIYVPSNPQGKGAIISVVVCDDEKKIKVCGFDVFKPLSDKDKNCQWLANCS